MATCFLAWELGGGAGHCAKLLPIAQGLLTHGHRVFVAARDLTSARRLFGPLEVEYLQAPFLLGRPLYGIRAPRSFAHILHNTGFADPLQLGTLVAAWRNLLRLTSAGVIVCDHAPTALLASRFMDIRRVVVGTGFTLPPDVAPLPDLRPWMPAMTEQLIRDELVVLERVNRLLEAESKPPLERLGQLYSDVDESFLLTFAELDHYPQRTGATHWGTWSPAGGVCGHWADAPGPKLFAYLKPPTASWNLAAILSLLRELKLPSLIYVPGVDPGWLQRFRSAQLRFSTQRLDIEHVARECELAVLHGTAGTATALLLGGVPQLNIPLFLEQILFSRRVSDLGAGLTADPSRIEQVAARLVALIRSRKYREAAQAFARQNANYDPQRTIQQIVTRVHRLISP